MSMQNALDLALAVLLAATLVQAIRLERALVHLQNDRAALEDLISGFETGTRQAESGIEQLRGAAEGMGQQLVRQSEAAGRLRDDMAYLVERGDTLADRLEALVRGGRTIVAAAETAPGRAATLARAAAEPAPADDIPPKAGSRAMPPGQTDAPGRRLPETALADGSLGDPSEDLTVQDRAPSPAKLIIRSQAERDFLNALRLVR